MNKISPGQLSKLSEKELLKIRFSDFELRIEGTWLEECVNQLYSELKSKGLRFFPECYLADEWLTPDGEPVVGIAFYLAHPRLIKLEQAMMKEVEGGSRKSCMKLLRHETGHAINYAYKLHRKKRWRTGCHCSGREHRQCLPILLVAFLTLPPSHKDRNGPNDSQSDSPH